MSALPDYPLRVERGGLAPAIDLPRPRMTPAEIPLTLSADVLRLRCSMNARAVLAEVVSLFAANKGRCDASDTHFADRLSISLNTVSRAVQELEDAGLVVKVTKRYPTGFYRTLTPDSTAIAEKATANPYPQRGARPTPKMGVAYPQNEGSPTPEMGAALPPKWGSNIPFNNTGNFHTLPDDAASAAALGSEKKIGTVEILSAALPAEVLGSAPRCAAPPSKKPLLMRDSALGKFPAFVGAWQAAAEANPDTYADYQRADLKHYFDALLDWSDANGKKKLDWLATIRSSMRNDVSNGKLRELRLMGGSADSPVLKRLATAEAALALNEYDEAGNRLN